MISWTPVFPNEVPVFPNEVPVFQWSSSVSMRFQCFRMRFQCFNEVPVFPNEVPVFQWGSSVSEWGSSVSMRFQCFNEVPVFLITLVVRLRIFCWCPIYDWLTCWPVYYRKSRYGSRMYAIRISCWMLTELVEWWQIQPVHLVGCMPVML